MASDSGEAEIAKASAGSPVSTAASSRSAVARPHIVDDDIKALKFERGKLMEKKKTIHKEIKKAEMRRARAKRKQASLCDSDLLEELERRRRSRENPEVTAANPASASPKTRKTSSYRFICTSAWRIHYVKYI